MRYARPLSPSKPGHAIRHTKIAQDYLVSLLIKPRE